MSASPPGFQSGWTKMSWTSFGCPAMATGPLIERSACAAPAVVRIQRGATRAPRRGGRAQRDGGGVARGELAVFLVVAVRTGQDRGGGEGEGGSGQGGGEDRGFHGGPGV